VNFWEACWIGTMTQTRSDGRIDVEVERLGTRDLVQEVKKMGR